MITEDTLVLYFYDELSHEERALVDAALGSDPALAARYEVLSRELADWHSPEPPPAPGEFVAAWHDSIERVGNPPLQKPRSRVLAPRLWILGMGAALATALVVGIGIGFRMENGATTDPLPDSLVGDADVTDGLTTPASFTRGLQVHLQQSRWEIDRLPGIDNANRIVLTMQLVQQNRMFERAATQSNAPNLARVLRAFEPILLQLANEDIAPQDAEALRRQLAFELKVMLTKLQQRPSEEAHTT